MVVKTYVRMNEFINKCNDYSSNYLELSQKSKQLFDNVLFKGKYKTIRLIHPALNSGVC